MAGVIKTENTRRDLKIDGRRIFGDLSKVTADLGAVIKRDRRSA